MSTAIARVDADGFRSDVAWKKRLGQYFTGVSLARLLAALGGADTASAAIDPMVGTGDMLIGCLEHGAKPAVLAGIEIDPGAHTTCLERLAEGEVADSTVLCGSAFSAATIRDLPTTSWDLCITNPPYVRYQSTSRATGGEVRLPSATEIRQGLIASIDELDALDDEDKRLFRELAKGYSGLADLAVPSWILCAGLVKVGGTLAMLVPTTWLSRDYAFPIRYLLSRWFDMRFVVEDADAAWFDEALVRTTLVVATRVNRRESAFRPAENDGYLHVDIGRQLADDRSLVGAAYPGEMDPDLAFVAEAEEWRTRRFVPKRAGLGGYWVPAGHVSGTLERTAQGAEWLSTVESTAASPPTARPTRVDLPLPLATALGTHTPDWCLTLEELGWRVGQGLRTGANQFFYVDLVETSVDGELVRVADALGGGDVVVPRDALEPVLRRQAELPDGFAVRSVELRGRALAFQGYALSEDVELAPGIYRPMARGLGDHVRHAATVNVGNDEEPKLIPDLSAVAPNARRPNPARPTVVARFWYQLPAFTDRHRPSLALARVNHGHPRTYLNDGRSAIIDANFSTLWPDPEALVDDLALLAVLNSVWTYAAMEAGCTVLGGGALKVEASHLRRLPIPNVSSAAWCTLSNLGQQLRTSAPSGLAALLAQIDELVTVELVGAEEAPAVLGRVRRLAAERLSGRSR
jgi:hypothetical protein